MNKNIVIIGFISTGKTAVGKALAKKLGKTLVDVDDLIATVTGKTPGEIYLSEGEITFRELEIDLIKSVSARDGIIISCGGGAVVNKINIDRLKRNGYIILLTADPEVIIKRTQNQKDRPIIDSGKREENIRRLLDERSCLWQPAADTIIDTTDKSVEEIAEIVIDAFKKANA